MESLNPLRHIEIYDPSVWKGKRVALIGAGTVGSNLAAILNRMQVSMTIFDHDTVEHHNLTTQTYGQADIGKTKVEAVLEQLALVQPDHDHKIVDEMFQLTDETFDLIISAVDSLDARRSIANMLLGSGIPILDGRVGREQVEVYYFGDAQAWLDQMPESADSDPCGARFTAYSAVIAAGLMANNVKRHLLGEKVQYRIIFDATTLTFIKV